MNAMAVATARGTQTDAELVALVRAGHDPAFEELYRRYRPRIGAFVHRMVRDEGRTEDLTQDAFVAALRRMRETDCELVFRPWIYEIARNAAIDLHRRAGRAQELSFDSDDGLPASDLLRYGASPGPDAAVIGRERFEHFRGALDELPDAHHQIIVLRELEGMSYREIGERMHLSEAAVESTLFRARRNLAHEYSQIGTGRRCTAVGVAMGRVSAGTANERDRVKVARHARRCDSCRRRALALGVDPAPRRAGRAAALVPALGLVRHQGGASIGALIAPGAPGIVAKAVSVLAAGAVVAGGGATLGGVGPLAIDHGVKPAAVERKAAPARSGPPIAPKAQDRPARPDATKPPPRRAPKGDDQPPPARAVDAVPESAPAPAPSPGIALPEVKVPEVAVPKIKVPSLQLPPLNLSRVVPGLPDVPAVDAEPVAGAVRDLRDGATSLLP